MAKRFFAQQNIAYDERDVIANESYMRELKEVAGRFITPTLVIDGEVLIGFGNNLERVRALLQQRGDLAVEN